MGAVNTTYTFTATDTITSTKMNNIIDETTMTADAIIGTTLEVASGKLKIRSQGITTNELGEGSVTSYAIVDGTIVNADINASADIAGSKLADNSTSGVKLIDSSVTAAKLDGSQTGTAPIYGARAWVSFDGIVSETSVGTVSRASGSTLATVTLSNHGMATGNIVNVAGGVATGIYTITKLTDNTFTFVTVATTLLSNVAITLYRRKINGSGNVNSIVDAGNAIYYVNMTIPMTSANYATSWGGTSDGVFGATYSNNPQVALKTTSSFQIYFRGTDNVGSANQPIVDLVVIC